MMPLGPEHWNKRVARSVHVEYAVDFVEQMLKEKCFYLHTKRSQGNSCVVNQSYLNLH